MLPLLSKLQFFISNQKSILFLYNLRYMKMAEATAKYSATTNQKGDFRRRASKFRNWISNAPKSDADFPAENGRYHLVVSYACPWASRCLAALNLKGLRSCISVSVVHPIFARTRPSLDKHFGWHFKSPEDPPVPNPNGLVYVECDETLTGSPDPVTGAVFVRDIYEETMKKLNPEGVNESVVYSVPLLWCKKTRVIVNNESEDLVRIISGEFNAFATHPEIDLFPLALQKDILEVNQWVYEYINNGVYRCGFSKSQEAYDEAAENLFNHLDKAEEILAKQRYLAGDGSQLTEADIRLFVTLVRFDEVYVVHFKTAHRNIREYPNLLDYCRELYQIPAIAESVNMKHIVTHYYASHTEINPFSLIPKSPDFLKLLATPHTRARAY